MGAAQGGIVAGSHGVLQKHARTFSLAGRLLPREVLDDAAVVYAFCRLADDVVDEAPDPNHARDAARALRRELDGETPPRPITRAYLEVCERRSIPLSTARDLLEGIASDLDIVRVADDSELLRYCYAVAGTVGVMMNGVLRVADPRAGVHAVELGIAMQLTNISRDVVEDAKRGRVYLPARRLEAHGVTQDAVLRGTADELAVRAVILELLELAERFYARADVGMGAIPLRARAAIMAAGRMYRAIGLRIRAGQADPMRERTVVPGRDKAGWVLSALMSAPFMTWT
ncbi:MAG: phytoene synthase [Myxococcota bacterium]|jgi:phytoene synthase